MTNGKRSPWTFTPNNCQVLFLHSDMENYSYVALTSEVITLFWKVNKQNFFLLHSRNAQHSVLGHDQPIWQILFFHRLLVCVNCQHWVWGLRTISENGHERRILYIQEALMNPMCQILWCPVLRMKEEVSWGQCHLERKWALEAGVAGFGLENRWQLVLHQLLTGSSLDFRDYSLGGVLFSFICWGTCRFTCKK